MQPVDLSSIAQHLGPGTGGLWLGEQQRNAMQESELGQQKTLEDIATMKQTRDIQNQKLPLELQQMRDTNAMAPVNLEKGKLGNEETKAKLSKAKYAEFLDGLTQMDPALVPMDQRAGYLNELSKRTGIDPEHPAYQMALRAHAAGGPQWEKFVQAVGVKPEERFKEQQAGARATEQRQSQEKIAQGNNEATRYAADQRLAAAQKRAGTATDILQAAQMGKLSYEKAAVALQLLAQQSDDPEERNRLLALSKDMEQRNLNQQNARNQGGGVDITQQGIQNRPPQQTVPPSVAGPGAAPAQVPPGPPPGQPPMAPQGQPPQAAPGAYQDPAKEAAYQAWKRSRQGTPTGGQ